MTNGREAHRQRECVQNMLMHCQPQTKANCVKIETKLNSISAKTTSRQETLTNRRGKNKEDPITHVKQMKSTSQSESQVQSEAPREKRVQTKTERRYRKPHSAEAARQGGREAFTEGPIKAIAEFRAWGRPRASEERNIQQCN